MRVSVIVCKATISRSRFTLLDAPTADPVAAVISVSGGIYLSFWMGVPVRAYIIELPWPTRRFLQTMSIIKYNIKKKECNGLTYARGDDLEIGFCVAFVCNIFLSTPKKGENLSMYWQYLAWFSCRYLRQQTICCLKHRRSLYAGMISRNDQ